MRYEALWLCVMVGLLLEVGLLAVVWWAFLFPVVSLAFLVASLERRDRRARHQLARVSEGVSASVAVVLLLLLLAAAYHVLEPAGQEWFGPAVTGVAAYGRLGLTVLALLGAVFFYATAHALEGASALPEIVGNPRYPRTVSGYRILRGNMIALFLVFAALAITFAIALELTLLLAYLENRFTATLLDFAVRTVLFWGAVLMGFLLAAAGLAGTVQALRGAREVGGDQVPILAAAAMLWVMSFLVHAVTAILPTVPGAIVAVLALSAVARTLSNFYPWRARLRIWFTALFLSGLQFPAHAVAQNGPALCAGINPSEPGLGACVTLLGNAGSLVAVLGGALFGYMFVAYYTSILRALRATRDPVRHPARPVRTPTRAPAPPSPLPPPPPPPPPPSVERPRVPVQLTDEALIPPPP